MGEIGAVFDHILRKVKLNKSPVQRQFMRQLTNAVLIQINDLDHFEFESVDIQRGDLVVLESEQLYIR